ncbi:MAG: hypothetical protein ABI785_04050 [Gemmatimonadales bacterium]
MCISYRLIYPVLGTALIGCGGGSLTLPDDGSPAALTAVGGNGQAAPVGSRLDNPLVVKLTDASSRPIAGVPVVFQFKIDVPDAQIDPEAETDSDGLASAQVRLGTSTGPHEVEARVASAAQLRATFVVTAIARGKGGKGDGHGDDD